MRELKHRLYCIYCSSRPNIDSWILEHYLDKLVKLQPTKRGRLHIPAKNLIFKILRNFPGPEHAEDVEVFAASFKVYSTSLQTDTVLVNKAYPLRSRQHRAHIFLGVDCRQKQY